MRRHRLGKASLIPMAAMCLAALLGVDARAGSSWDESVLGDLSGAFDSPTHWTLSAGVNSLFATTGDYDPDPPFDGSDVEYVTIHLPPGTRLANIFMQSYQGDDGVAWIGMQEGTPFGFHRDDVYEHIGDIFGGAHFGTGNGDPIGMDLLPVMGAGSYVPHTFQPPLAGPAYTFWIQQTGLQCQYQLDFVVVPEPATMVSFGLGAAVLFAAVRRASRRRTNAVVRSMAVVWLGLSAINSAQGQSYVIRDPADVPPPITRTEPTTVRITSTIQEVTAEFSPGTSYEFWTFDGTVPGPLFRVMQGDTVELTLANAATNGHHHNIDLHAVNGPHGGGMETMVEPGESKTLTFEALNTGAYIYHCAVPPAWQHIAQGMYGGIIVEPPGGLPPVDREFYVVQGDWYATTPDAAGHRNFDFVKALDEQPTHFLFNGHTEALSTLNPLEAFVGETVRIYFGVGGPNVGSNFHVIGEIFDKVYSGSPETYVLNEETVYVPPGSMSIFEMTLNQPGDYILVDHALTRTEKGALGMLHVAAAVPEPSTFLLSAMGVMGLFGVLVHRFFRRANGGC